MREQRSLTNEQHGPVAHGQPARRFGNYDLVRRIDVGGMGEVYLARQRTAFGREVAVKIIRSDLVHDTTARKRFLREAEVSAHLKHEHILPLFEFGEEQGHLFLVTPYIEGGTLSRRLQSGPIPLSEVEQLFSALVQAVAYIHKRGVVHRDLKPSNILLDKEDGGQVYVRLIDFGIASIQGTAANAPLTTAGNEMGTIAYMAPERLNGVAAPSNDIYSLGVILHQMLTGHLPTSKHTTRLPPPLEAVIYRCTALNVEKRFATADELLLAFNHACQTMEAATGSPTGSRPAITPTPPAQRTLPDLDKDDAPTPKRLMPGHPLPGVTQESGALPGVGTMGPTSSLSGRTFSREDYNAPTTSIGPATGPVRQQRQLADEAVVVAKAPSRAGKRRKRTTLILPLAIVIVSLLIVTTVLVALEGAINARVTLSPQVQTIQQIFTITAKPGLSGPDANTASIPVSTLTTTRSQSKTGPTTGRPLLCIFNCPKTVSSVDAIVLGLQVKQSLITQITQDLNSQLQARNANAVGNPSFADLDSSVNPPVDSRSDKVTVTVKEQGSINYYSNKDAQDLARLLLRQKVGPRYQLINQLTRIGQPVLKSIGFNSVATLSVAAAGVMEYQISPDELQTMQNHVKGLKVKQAIAFIQQQPGVDAKTVAVKLSYGDTMPVDAQHITILPVDPTNLPPVQLPAVQAPPVQPSATPSSP